MLHGELKMNAVSRRHARRSSFGITEAIHEETSRFYAEQTVEQEAVALSLAAIFV
jgi:hypothetical protein